MEPEFPRNQLNQELQDIMGSGPILPPKQKSRFPKPLIFAGVLIALFSVVGLVAAVLAPSNETTKTALYEVNEEGLDFTQVSPGIQMLQSVATALASDNYEEIEKSYAYQWSPMFEDGLNSDVVASFVGDDVDWSSCQFRQDTQYPSTLRQEVDGKTYDSVRVVATCPASNATAVKDIDFDIRKATDDSEATWELFYMVLKEKRENNG